MRLIDADELMKCIPIEEYCSRLAVANAPTIDAEPERKKGKWIHGRELSREMIGNVITAIFYEGWECSECHCLVQEEREPLWKYCPYCGAKMDGGKAEYGETYKREADE